VKLVQRKTAQQDLHLEVEMADAEEIETTEVETGGGNH
jgi:hypothetical protein